MKILPLLLVFVSVLSYATSFNDVQPKDIEYLQLIDLSERYGCAVGVPNSTISRLKANRPISRYEFAAYLNVCVSRVEELVATVTTDMVSTSDLDTLNNLKILFKHEISILNGIVE